jgi:glycosyltransferase involved in cell wall biosynthesis
MSISTKPRLSVVIPAHINGMRADRVDLFRQVLSLLASQTLPKYLYEIIIVDDGSPCELSVLLAEELKVDNVHLLRQSQAGPAAARNAGTRSAVGDVILYLGDDILVSKNMLESHLAIHERMKDVIVINSVKGSSRSVLGKELLETSIAGYKDGERYEMPTGSPFCTSCVSVERRWMMVIPFDEQFPYPAYEDTDVGFRLHRQGVRFTVTSAAEAIHDHVHNSATLRARARNAGRSHAYMRVKHPDWPDGISHLHSTTRTQMALLLHFVLSPLSAPLSRAGPRLVRGWAINSICKYEFLSGFSVGLPRLGEMPRDGDALQGGRS